MDKDNELPRFCNAPILVPFLIRIGWGQSTNGLLQKFLGGLWEFGERHFKLKFNLGTRQELKFTF